MCSVRSVCLSQSSHAYNLSRHRMNRGDQSHVLPKHGCSEIKHMLKLCRSFEDMCQTVTEGLMQCQQRQANDL
eukprot:scaffold145736_cov40-Tisochrysis_lutea.AAC.1